MQTVKWLTFCISNAVTRSIVHFFPASTNISAPYAAECSLKLFGRDGAAKQVTIEGARFGQPDGVRLDDVFPQLQEGTSGFFGLEFSMATAQPRTDLNASSCVIELSSRGHSCRFKPLPLVEKSEEPTLLPSLTPRQSQSILGIKDAYNTTSLVFVNSTSDVYQPHVSVCVPMSAESAKTESSMTESSMTMQQVLQIDPIAANSVVEVELGEKFVSTEEPIECSWGLIRVGGVWFKDPFPQGVAVYLMYRDVVTRRPISVCAV